MFERLWICLLEGIRRAARDRLTLAERRWCDDQIEAGRKKNGPNPPDRGKLGVKRSVLTDARGVPLGVAVAGGNVHDQKLLDETLTSVPLRRPRPRRRNRQHLCLDKRYDAPCVEQAVRRRRCLPHIRARGEKAAPCRRGKARRWVVERVHSWINRYRRLLVRWEMKAANYLGFLHLCFARVALRAAGVLG